MKRTLLLLSALLAPSLSGCDGYWHSYTVPYSRTFNFDLDTQSSTTTSASLTRSQLLGALDLPADATIDFVSIESVTYKLDAAAGNAATQGTFGIQYDELPGAPGPENFAGNFGVPVGAGTEQPLAQLQAAAVNRFSGNFLSMLHSSSPTSIVVTLNSLTRTPATARLHVTGYIRISGSISFRTCQEDLPMGLVGGANEECVVGL